MRFLSLFFFFLSLFPSLITSQSPVPSVTGSDYTLYNSGTSAWSIQVMDSNDGTKVKYYGDNIDVGVTPGGIVTFRLKQAAQHPFGFSTVRGEKNQPTTTTKNYQIEADSGCRFYAPAGVPTAAYLPLDTTGTIPCILKWTVPPSFKNGDLYYQCVGHPTMTGAFFVQADNGTVATSTTATPTTSTPTTTPNSTTTPPTNPSTTTPPTNPTTTTPPTNPTTTSPPTNSSTSTIGNITTPTNGTSSSSITFNITTSSSSSSTGIIVGSSSTAVGTAGAASNLLPSIGIMFLIAAVMAIIPL